MVCSITVGSTGFESRASESCSRCGGIIGEVVYSAGRLLLGYGRVVVS